ncbi:MAG: thrombospondin type 3 repeat-containing protein [Ruminococcus flavefaciens]|nr:thrombospondin type 3 repeat-containing protein [Ruminococcus flavefaciens]
MAATLLLCFPATAEEGESYPYTMFAASSDDGAITVNADNFCVNGNVATNGTIVSSGNVNINGIRTENTEESMIFIFDKIDNQYFSASNVDEHDEDYILDEMNININVPIEVLGEATLTGNININNALKSLEDVNLYGEVKNTNDSVIFSKYGDIVIDSQNVNLNGLVYAPFDSVTINAQNLNNVVIIAESIVLTCPSVNANNSNNASSFVGTTSEPLDIPYDEWQYMKDENENDFPDFFENYENWVLLKDTDGDHLPDCVEQFLETDATLADTDGDMLDDYYEVFVTGTDPTLSDTDSNGVADGDEDFDSDGLTNYQEYVQGTSPWNSDSDSDNLSDGDEVNTYGTNPLEPDTDFDGLSDADEVALGTNPNLFDTDGDGTPDGEEKFAQTYVYDVENKDCAVEQVIVSMEGTGNIQKNTSVESVMNKDVICSDVVGLIGEPFEIESESKFDTATITFKIDQTKLGNAELDNLMFLWYDEENYEFVEMETMHDTIDSTVSITTTHFSRYMVVDKYQWFEAWAVEFDYNPGAEGTHGEPDIYHNAVLAIDCSGSMDSNDKISINFGISPLFQMLYPKTCQRIEVATQFIQNMNDIDKSAVVVFSSKAL